MDEINHIKARVELLAARQDRTLSDVAKAMGRSPQSLQAVLERGNPVAGTLLELAEALGVTPNDLFEEVTPEEYGELRIPRKRKAAEAAQ